MTTGWRHLCLVSLLFPLLALAETRVFTEYIYDASGNIIGIQRDVSNAQPVVSSINPNVVRIGQTFSLTASGSDLRAAQITPQDNNVLISNVSSSADAITFNLFATTASPLGPYTLTFTTPLGATTATITIQPRAPTLVIGPSPLAIAPGATQTLDIRLTGGVDIADNVFTFSVRDPARLAVSPTSVTIAEGATVPDQAVTVTALAAGTTALSISVSNLPDVVIPVFITGEFVPPQGGNQFFAPNLGVEIEIPDAPQLLEIGPFAARPLGVQLGDAAPPRQSSVTPIVANRLGLAIGNIATATAPAEMAVGSGPIDIVVSGVGLDAVTGVAMIPADDITLGNFTISADGTALTLPVTVADSAAEGLRQIVLTTATGVIPFAAPGLDRINIAINLPVIESISPVVVVRGSDAVTVTVRGQHLDNVQAINIMPQTGMVGSNPQVVLDGRVLTFDLSVPANEPLGTRVVTLTTDAGTSTAVASPANSFEVVNAPVETLTPIVAPLVGVSVADDTSVSSDLDIRANNVGVSFGNAILGLRPEQGRIGTNLTLTIDGVGLQSVADIIITPDTGITASNLLASADGSQVTVDIAIAADAPEVLRRIDLVQADLVSLVSAASANVNRFLVVGNQPSVTAITPNFVLRNAAPSTLTLLGEFLDGASAVAIQPPQGVSVSVPVVAADGRSLTVNVAATADAALGQRVVVVSTPAGDTSAIASAANMLTIANTVASEVTPIIAPALGVQLEAGAGSQPTVDRLITSAQLGVEVEVIAGPVSSTFNNLGFTQLGTVVGDIATAISPRAAALNSTVMLAVEGAGLTNVTSVSLNPSTGITVSSPPTINSDGTQLTVELTVAGDAALGARQVVLNTADSRIAFANVAQSQLNVVTAMPQIDSISPIQAVVGSTVELVIRGVSLDGTTAVAATPSDSITFATVPFVNSTGTEVNIQMNIAAGAAAGPRVITVITPVGASDTNASSANTFTVITN